MRTAIFAVASALLPTCAYAVTELVMREGVTIEARKDNTSIKVTSGKGFDRTYEWDRCKMKSDMGARTQRWYGSMGIYDPAPSSSASGGGCSGISRTVVQEGQVHFDDMQFALKWIERRPDKTVWTNDGLLVSWDIEPRRRQLNVDVWLMCINGKRPTQLVGALDSAIRVSSTETGKGIHECAQVGRDVIDQTRVQFEADWKMFDEYRERRAATRGVMAAEGEKSGQRPRLITSLKGISIGDKLSDAMLKDGAFEKIEPPKGVVQKYADEVRYVSDKKRVAFGARGGTVKTVAYDCNQEGADHTRANGIGCNDTGDAILKAFGDKVRVLCAKRPNADTTTLRVFDVVEYGTRYLVRQNKVQVFFIFSKEELQSLVGVNWIPCK